MRNNLTSEDNQLLKWAVMALFFLCLWKFTQMRFWTHAYVGQAYNPTRFVYYTEFLASVMAYGLFILNIHTVWKRLAENKAIALFISFAFFIVLVPGIKNITPLSSVSGYLESLIVLALMLQYWGTANLLRWLNYFAVVFIVINLISLAKPSTSIMIGEFSGYARGLCPHRNDLSHIATICIYFLVADLQKTLPAFIKWGVILGGCVLIGLAGSVQGILLTIIGIFIFLISKYTSKFKHPFVIYTLVTLLVIMTIIGSFITLDEFLGYFGRDSTFTGRDRIWGMSEYLLSNMPWSGYGIGSMGSTSPYVSMALLQSFQVGTAFGTAHNSYLEAFLSFGWIGGTLFIIAVIISFASIVKEYQLGNKAMVLPTMLIVFGVLGGFTASEKLFLPQFGWFTFVLATLLAQQNNTFINPSKNFKNR